MWTPTLARTLLLTCLGVLPAQASDTAPTPATLDDLAWMTGSWSATSEDGTVSEEHWTTPAGRLMVGMHRDVRKDGGAFFEFLRIEETAEGIHYVASPRGGPATAFRLTGSTPHRAVFENPDHDFPQRIVYRRDGDTLCAGIAAMDHEPDESHTWCWRRASL